MKSNILNKIFSKNEGKQVVTRFAPSPTGFLHIGGVRTGLFSYLYAKKMGGKFILRIEDTDKERSREEWAIQLIEDIKWLGINWDNEEVYTQSSRGSRYKELLEKIIAEDKAYISKEEVKEEGQRAEVIRFKNPNKTITFHDEIRGDITFDTTELGDFIIAKSLDEPIFHFAVVVDDFDMGITHVVRAEEHLSNTPRQILIQEAINAKRPVYAHLPLVLAEDKSKLSKRKHGETASLNYYRERGYFPEAIINFVAMLGWNPGTEQEIFSMKELIEEFSLEKVQKSGAVFNIEKLKWYNKEYLKNEDLLIVISEIRSRLLKSEISPVIVEKLAPTLVERINVYGDVDDMIESGELDLYISQPQYEKEKLLWKKSPDLNESKEHLEKLHELLSNVSEWNSENIKSSIWDYAEEKGKGNVLWPFRYSLSGKDQSPDPIEISSILGKEETLTRIKFAINLIN